MANRRNSSRANRAQAGVATQAQNQLKITRRVVNTKRHTTGYIVGGQFQTVRQVAQLASRGRILGVRVVGNHIQAIPGRKKLINLPTTVQRS